MNLFSLARRKLKIYSSLHQLQLITIATISQTNAIRVDTSNDPKTTKVSESVDPKAEALTLVIHNFPMPKLRKVKVIDRNDDDLVVIHSSRPKRKPTTRNRRPSSQFRSKIKHPGSSSNFGGFKDYSSSELRFPPFPTKNFGEPQRASNKFKKGPKPYDGYSYSPPAKKRSRKKPSTVYGPPPTFNQFESAFDSGPSSPHNGQRLQTLQSIQQQQTHFPSFSIDAADPPSSISNFYTASNDQFPQPINNFPLEPAPTFNSQKTSYGSPIQGPPNPSNYNFNPNIVGTSLNSNLNANLGSQSSSYSNFNQSIQPQKKNKNQNQNLNPNFPKLPSRYEPKDFSTPTRPSPLGGGSNHFLNDYTGFNDGSETQNVQSTANHNINADNRIRNSNKVSTFNKFNNFDYDFKGQKNSAPEEEEEDDGNYDYVFTTRRPRTTTTTTTEEPEPSTKRPKKTLFGKRKRPAKIPHSHILDTDDLRDAFTESSDFHEIGLNSEDFINFDSQRNNKRNNQQPNLHEIHSTLKTARKQSNALRTALGDDFEIVSVHKSLEKDPNESDPFEFQRKHDQDFVVDSDVSFAPLAASSSSVMWNGDVKNFPRNHRFS